MNPVVTLESHDAADLITLRNPPVNSLSHAVRAQLAQAIEASRESAQLYTLITGAGRCFSAGAEISEFGTDAPADTPTLPDLLQTIESHRKPVIALIHGNAVGGGFELALACHYRLMLRGTRIGLPEVKLGLIPGAGGTQRLPRIIPFDKALVMIVDGNYIDEQKAEHWGLADRIVEDNLLAEGKSFASMVIDRPLQPISGRKIILPVDGKPAEAIDRIRQGFGRRTRGLIAPEYCLRSVANVLTLSFEEGMKKERQYFITCRDSPQSKAQRYVFFAEKKATRVPQTGPGQRAQGIKSAAVIGAGTMGAGIAQCFATAGIPVTLIDQDVPQLEKAKRRIHQSLSTSVKKGKMTQSAADEALGHLQTSPDDTDIANSDIVIEAVFEDMVLKRKIFSRLDELCQENTILASNTSTLDINEMAAATNRPDKVVGMHFFSPANVMRLLENVRCDRTSAETIVTAMQLGTKLGKVPVLVSVCDGFVGNRMLYAYSRQANSLLERGALPQQVDRVLEAFGFAMGPFAVGDLAGLDIGWQVRKHRQQMVAGYRSISPIGDQICELGRFGQKTGAGWFLYEQGSRRPLPDPAVEALIKKWSAENGIKRKVFSDEEILHRCLFALINEGAYILQEGVAQRASDIDVVWLNGYGFPLYRGGPMFFADEIGLPAVVNGLNSMREKDQSLPATCPLLEELSERSARLSSFENS